MFEMPYLTILLNCNNIVMVGTPPQETGRGGGAPKREHSYVSNLDDVCMTWQKKGM